jgi:hypothetical protein
MGAPPVDTCTRLDRLDQLLAHLADALRAKAENRENDQTRTTSCTCTRNVGTGQSGRNGGSHKGIP